MRRAILPTLAAVVLAVGAVGCGKDASTPDASSARQLAGFIADGDAGCRDFKPVAKTDPAVGDAGACTVDGEQVNLAVFSTEQARDRGTIERLKGCVGRRALNPGSAITFSYVRGPTWIVLSADRPAVSRVAKALHGDVERTPC